LPVQESVLELEQELLEQVLELEQVPVLPGRELEPASGQVLKPVLPELFLLYTLHLLQLSMQY
jgi:hypothetical protein